MKIENVTIITLVIIILFLICFIVFRPPKTEVKTIETVKTDTIVDTLKIKVDNIKYIEVKVLDTLYVEVHDTLYTTQKHYADSLSDIWVSGINPSLDSVKYKLPCKTIYVDRLVETEKIIKKRWYEDRLDVSVGVGCGYGLINKQADIYLGFHFGLRLN